MYKFIYDKFGISVLRLEIEANLITLREDKMVLDEALVTEQNKVRERRDLIDEAKGAMAAQNQEISKRLILKEQREAQVLPLPSQFFFSDFILCY